MNSRRHFIITIVPAALAVGATSRALAQPAKVDENDPVAKGVKYKHVAPAEAKGNICSGCQLYQGKPADAWGACPIVGNKLVAGKGWCSAWVKKA